jgi:hypothetical protein
MASRTTGCWVCPPNVHSVGPPMELTHKTCPCHVKMCTWLVWNKHARAMYTWLEWDKQVVWGCRQTAWRQLDFTIPLNEPKCVGNHDNSTDNQQQRNQQV